MVTIKDGCGCDPCDCDWKQKLKEAYSRAIQSVNKIGDETGRVYFPDGTGFVKMPLPTKEQIDSIAEIDGIKASVDSLNVTVPALETQVNGVTESLVSGVEVLNGTTAGKFKVRIEREKAALIDSNDYDLSKVNSIELIQGSGPAMVKAQLTLSDGTVLRSDDFLFTSESIGTDVYISSFTFKNGNVDGTISADIGLNNGTTLEANNFVVPTDPSVVSTITDLQTRVSAIEGDSGLNELKAAVADLQVNKADVNNTNQTIKTGTINVYALNLPTGTPSTVNPDSCAIGIKETESGKLDTNKPLKVTRSYYDDFAGDYTSEPLGNVALLNDDGSPKNFTTGGGGEVWEEVSLINWPTDWKIGDRIRITTHMLDWSANPASSWDSSPYSVNLVINNSLVTQVEGYIGDTAYIKPVIANRGNTYCFNQTIQINSYGILNSGVITYIGLLTWNGGGSNSDSIQVTTSNNTPFIVKIERLKAN